MRRHMVSGALVIGALVLGSAAFAAYPDRAVKLIVPWAAGGDTDAIFRPLVPWCCA
jgi:putative tricarboxylic transport membrane protein